MRNCFDGSSDVMDREEYEEIQEHEPLRKGDAVMLLTSTYLVDDDKVVQAGEIWFVAKDACFSNTVTIQNIMPSTENEPWQERLLSAIVPREWLGICGDAED